MDAGGLAEVAAAAMELQHYDRWEAVQLYSSTSTAVGSTGTCDRKCRAAGRGGMQGLCGS